MPMSITTSSMVGSPTHSLLVSILINTFNYGKYVEQAIKSCLQQTFPKDQLELIVVDDGSRDDTSLRIQQFSDQVKYINKENGGQASAINRGISEARGDIICLLDADDYFYPSKVQLVVKKFANDRRIGVVYNNFDYVDDNCQILGSGSSRHLLEGDLSARTLLGYSSGAPTSGISARRKVLDRVPIPETAFRISADRFYLNILPLVTRIGAVPTPLHAYRIHGHNLYLGETIQVQNKVRDLQREAIWAYANEELHMHFFEEMHRKVANSTCPLYSCRMRSFLGEFRWIIRARGPADLKLRRIMKNASTYFLPNQFRFLAKT